MPENNDVQYYLGRLCGAMEAMQEDISEIKENQIANGQKRMNKIEDKVQELSVWKKTATSLMLILVGAMGWVEAKMNLIGGLFSG